MAGLTTRMLPVSAGGGTVTGYAGPTDLGTASGRRYYSASGGQTIDAVASPQDGDANVLASQGFVAVCLSGTTAQRMSLTPGGYFKAGTMFLDTTLGLIVCWDGLNWRNPVNGNVA